MCKVKDMIDSMFHLTCMNLVSSNKGGNSIEGHIYEWLTAQRAYELCSQLENAIHKAYVLNCITETECKFVLSALEAAVDSEVGL